MDSFVKYFVTIFITFIVAMFFSAYLVNGPLQSNRERASYSNGVEDGMKGHFKIVPKVYYFKADSLDYEIVPIKDDNEKIKKITD